MMNFHTRKLIAALLLCSGTAVAADYPTKPIRLVVPFPAGGPVDITARTLAPRLGDALGQRILIDNRGGAGGVLGSEIVAKSPADGHTLLLCTTGNAINVSLVPNLPYDIRKDFAPVSMVAIITSILVVHPSLPVKSVKDLIALAKAKPDALSYASTGNGAPTHLAGELFKSMAGVKIVHVPYKGAAPAVIDLISGHVQLSFISAPGAMPHVQEKRLRVLAVTNNKRSVLLPEIPTISEAGLKGYESEGWHGLFTPTGTPRPVIDRLYKEISTLLRDQKINALLAAGGAEPVGMPPDEFGKALHREIEKWAKVVKASGMKMD
jgi:tripartite-type tricarboxylate transporter receptor subunit TctC